MSKNWPSDPRVGYKSPSNLVELIQINLDFEDELEKFEGSFEQDERIDIQNVERNLRNFFGAIFILKIKFNVGNNNFYNN
jgi:hypothetical protein